MAFGFKSRLGRWLTRLLVKDLQRSEHSLLYDFDRLCYEIRPGDVILVEGHSRVSNVIKLITQSSWTHAALYIGRLLDIEDDALRTHLEQHYRGDARDQLIIEALLGEGTVVYPLHKYRNDHLRICRPTGLVQNDANAVISYAIRRLGTGYDLRQLLDLARFMFPFWGILPRRWRSSLFEHNVGQPTRAVCSSMLAEAFGSVHFPILPFVDRADDGRIHMHKRNPKLFTPRDFDFSPYFDIIKYPILGLDDVSLYRRLPWGDVEQVCNTLGDCYTLSTDSVSSSPAHAQPGTSGADTSANGGTDRGSIHREADNPKPGDTASSATGVDPIALTRTGAAPPGQVPHAALPTPRTGATPQSVNLRRALDEDTATTHTARDSA